VAANGDLQRYRVIAKLGSGGMATVDLAQDTVLGRQVALKRMSGESDLRGLSRLRREALVGASISHPNLVSVYDVVSTDDGHLVIVMEYVEGETLRQLLSRQGRLPAQEVLRILGGVAAGLDAINERGIVHRDVKPSNILLGANGAVKVADLGIASDPDRTRITTSGSVLGSLGYMAPEQLSEAPVTSAIDVYALAAVAFELLSGVKARRESNPVALAHAISTQDPPSITQAWAGAPRALDAVLTRGMARDPARRPRSAGELVARLRTALEPEDTTARLAPVAAPAADRRPPAPVGSSPPRVPAAPVGDRRATPAAPVRTGAARAAPARTAPDRRRSRAGLLTGALLGLAAVAAALVVALSSGGGSSPPPPSTTTAASKSGTRTHHHPKHVAASAGAGTGTSSSVTSSATATDPASATSSASASTTTSASSSPSPTGSTAATSPVSAVTAFYTLAAAHRYPDAWMLADSAMQSQLGGYASFQSDQAGDRSITFRSAHVVSQSASSARVAIATTSVRTTGTQHCSGTVDLVPATPAGHWQLDHIDIGCS
jgi:serine/threonine protein kinase